MYPLLFLTATVLSAGAAELELRRAEAFINSLPIPPQDQRIFADEALSYRKAREPELMAKTATGLA
jgi:hypothetical protein